MDAEIVKQLINLFPKSVAHAGWLFPTLGQYVLLGTQRDFHWYRKTLELINFYLWHGTLNRANFRSTDLYRDVIRIRVLQRIFMSFAGGNPTLYNAWSAHYEEEIKRGLTDFFEPAVSSFQFLSNEVTNFEFDSHYHAERVGTVVSMD